MFYFMFRLWFVCVLLLFQSFASSNVVVASQLHYNLGKTLYYICEGKDVGDTIFLIASQINHGKESIQKDGKELSVAVAKLNMKAGKKALDGCDHETAYFYFLVALSLLPNDNWESYYDLSLRLNFLMARAANSSCKYDEAELILQSICGKAQCLQDKLPAYILLSQSKFPRLSLLSVLTSFLSLNVLLLFSPPRTGPSESGVHHMLFYLNSAGRDSPRSSYP